MLYERKKVGLNQLNMNGVNRFRIIGFFIFQIFIFGNLISQPSILLKVGMDFTNAEIKNDNSSLFRHSITNEINSSYSIELGLEDQIAKKVSLGVLISSTKKEMGLDTEPIISITDYVELRDLTYRYHSLGVIISYDLNTWLELGLSPYLAFVHQSKIDIRGVWIRPQKIEANFEREEIGLRCNFAFKLKKIRLEVGYREILHVLNTFEPQDNIMRLYSLDPTRSFFISIGYQIDLKKK